jgi:hypothetical protein
MQTRRQIASAWVGWAVLVSASCAGGQAQWSVKAENQARFEETTRVCHLLTDESGGELSPEKFEKCMKRRGWRRQNLLERLFRCD